MSAKIIDLMPRLDAAACQSFEVRHVFAGFDVVEGSRLLYCPEGFSAQYFNEPYAECLVLWRDSTRIGLRVLSSYRTPRYSEGDTFTLTIRHITKSAQWLLGVKGKQTNAIVVNISDYRVPA